GVVVKGDESSGNIDWYGVIKKIIALDFPQGKEIYGIIDIDKTRFSDEKALDEFIEETQTRTIVDFSGKAIIAHGCQLLTHSVLIFFWMKENDDIVPIIFC
ncbi:hypothetical protein ACJX0J_026096, partial [Zea mays]